MNKKKNPKLNSSRAAELRTCENKILEMFAEKHVTVSEALFIFEKIKFAALYGEMAIQAAHTGKLTPQSPSQKKEQAMFR